jgi:drug/metabolite transporter (DMT)-like permease
MKKGVIYGLFTAGISGFSIFANTLFVSTTDPLIFTCIRNFVVALFLTAMLIVGGKIKKLTTLSKKEWGKLLAIGAIGGGIPFALFFTGLSQIGAVNSNILQKTLFLWVAIMAVPILKERISKIQLFGYITLFIGMFFFGGTYTIIPKTGTWLVLAATILWAIENVVAKITLKTIPPVIVAWGRIVFGLPFLVISVSLFGKLGLLVNVSSYTFTPIISSSILLTLYMTTWYSALAFAPATLVSSVLVFAPVVTAVISLIVLKKPILGSQVVMGILFTAGTLLLITERLILKRRQIV